MLKMYVQNELDMILIEEMCPQVECLNLCEHSW